MSDPQDRNAEEPVPVRYICPATWGGEPLLPEFKGEIQVAYVLMVTHAAFLAERERADKAESEAAMYLNNATEEQAAHAETKRQFECFKDLARDEQNRLIHSAEAQLATERAKREALVALFDDAITHSDKMHAYRLRQQLTAILAAPEKDLPSAGERCRPPSAEFTGSDANLGAKPAAELSAAPEKEGEAP